MTHQPESALELALINQLHSLGHAIADIKDEAGLVANLKTQLEKHNKLKFSNGEFALILNHLNKGNIFERAKILRDKMALNRDDGTVVHIEFMNLDHWCQNEFQVTHQVTQEDRYVNRYDVTLLINGLPLVQIELKRRGLELKEAFNQINRYQKHSFNSNYGLYQYLQIFVISNGVNTKYFANNRNQSFKQTFYWADSHNQNITQLEEFTKDFLEPCHIAKMIAKYTVLNETDKCLMVLRPYQYYATEAIIDRVKNNPRKNGYIWHTTGSGKTLTSFKTSQILIDIPKVHKVVFVVDRKDLDYQTISKFNDFAKGSVDGTDNTNQLVKQFEDDNTKLIVTTLQKLNVAISRDRHLSKMEKLKNKRIIFIFDECHRSQFGETHNRIKQFFNNYQMFGFTGTPIFADNATDMRTTKDLFDDCLHKYVITDAIKDENVLKFSVEYVGRYKQKQDSRTYVDINVEDIDTEELLDSNERLTKITNYIIANHERKSHNRQFNAMFCVSSIQALIKYYELFKAAKVAGRHKLRIATIFSFNANENDEDANGITLDDLKSENINKHSRDKLEEYIADYNVSYGSSYTTKDSQSFYNYFTDLSKRVKDHAKSSSDQQIDILLVVNMFLTGFDSKTLNTLYVDKNLKYHGLIQAYSRTNRILNEVKSQGNIVVFRNLKQPTDDAIALFSNEDAREIILMEPYEDYVAKFNRIVAQLMEQVPTVDRVNTLLSEKDELSFIQVFRELMRVQNILTTFTDFTHADLAMDAQGFEDYKSKYLDLYDKVKSGTAKEKVSILNDVDFELELVHRDEINVSYILTLLQGLAGKSEEERTKRSKEISNILNSTPKLRSKRALIEKFIADNVPLIEDSHDVSDHFGKFWSEEQIKSFNQVCTDEKVVPEKLEALIEKYLYTQKKPLNDDIVTILEVKPKLMERRTILPRVWARVSGFIDTFIDGVGNKA